MELFKKTLQSQPAKRVKTANGADTFETSKSPLVDLFFVIGSSRGKDVTNLFEQAYAVDQMKALRMLFWTRDIRQGAGERQTFRNLIKHLESRDNLTVQKLIGLIPEYGRWDDMLEFTDPRTKKIAFTIIKDTLMGESSQKALCAKWMPRKGAQARELREFMGLNPKQYRKLLVGLTNVVETAMCSKDWNNINFSHVPSVAAARYQKAFGKNAPEAYSAYKNALVKVDPVTGKVEAKVSAGAVYPHDVLKSIVRGDKEVAKAQWESLPNYMGDNSALPVLDTSSSMESWNYYGYGGSAQGGPSPIDICISIGMYVADKQKGGFKDVVCSFGDESELHVLTGDIVAKANWIGKQQWGYSSTNIEAAFKAILSHAVKNKLPQEELPKMLLIISDMEFNSCTKGTAYETAKANYEHRGYKLPKVVFWQVNGRQYGGNNPVTFREDGTALISGFSPNILKTVLSGDFEKYTPEAVMNATIMTERYSPIEAALRG